MWIYSLYFHKYSTINPQISQGELYGKRTSQSTCSHFILAFFWLPWGFLSCYVASVIDKGLLNIAHLQLAKGEFAVIDIVFTLSPFQTILLASVDKEKSIWVGGRQVFKTWIKTKNTFTACGYIRGASFQPLWIARHQDEAGVWINMCRVEDLSLSPFQLKDTQGRVKEGV